LTYTLFHGQNRIISEDGTNHWILFTEQEVDSREKFESNFMTDFIKGKISSRGGEQKGLFGNSKSVKPEPLVFSEIAQAVFEAGKSLWQYYHQQPKCNVNASLYDIRAYFQGRNDKGRMNNRSEDETYTVLIDNLREELKTLAEKIAIKVYEYGFLKV